MGATSSIAQALCHELARRSHALALIGRDESELVLLAGDLAIRYQTTCRIILLNILDEGFSADRLIETIGQFDGMVIAIGDLPQDVLAPQSIAYNIYVNYTAPALIATSAAAYLAQKGTGNITIISSVAGDRGRQSNYPYGAAKAALTAFASGLRNRYARQGVQVLTVKPGFIDTPMTWDMNSPLIVSRQYAARAIAHAMYKKKDSIYVPFYWRFIMAVICLIPERIFKRLSL